MSIDAIIHERTVRDALRSLLFGTDLHGSPLLRLRQVEARARSGGIIPGRAERVAALKEILEEAVRGHVLRLRAHEGQEGPSELPVSVVERTVSALQRDFASGDPDREAWGMLEARYLQPQGLEMQELARRIGVSRKTLSRRLARGHERLAQLLREREREEAMHREIGASVPRFTTSFVGRERERADLRKLVSEHRIVTLTGPGGIGKSRLAAQLARDLESSFADGVRYVELVSASPDADLAGAVAEALGLHESAASPPERAVLTHLAPRHVLLVFDNCEHVAQEAGALTRRLLERCEALHVVATSREELHLAGQAVYRVPPLSLPDASAHERSVPLFDAVQLFGVRAASAPGRFRVQQDLAPRIARICSRLEGIPLAIELAAARLRYLSLDELETRIDDRFTLLRDGRHALRPGHESLRATLDWSVHLLDEAERTLFRRLAVFHGGWTLDAAEEICTGDALGREDVLDLLAQLEAKSLVQVRHDGPDTRYASLETVRLYGMERLDGSDEASVVRDRHLHHFVSYAEGLADAWDRPDAGITLDRVGLEAANVREALRWSRTRDRQDDGLRLVIAMQPYWLRRGSRREGLRLTKEAVEAARGVVPPELLAEGRAALGSLLVHLSEYEPARRVLVDAVRRLRELGKLELAGKAQLNVANTSFYRGDLDRAIQDLEEAIAMSEAAGDVANVASAKGNLGNIAFDRGDYQVAKDLLCESLEMKRRAASPLKVSITLHNLGRVQTVLGDYEQSRLLYQECLEIARAYGDRPREAHSLGALSDVAYRVGDYARAESLARESHAIVQELEDPLRMVYCITDLAAIYLAQDKLDDAFDAYADGLRRASDLENNLLVALPLDGLAEVASAREDTPRAMRLTGAAERLRDDANAVLDPDSRVVLRELLEKASAAIGADAVQRHLDEGRERTLDDVIAYALGTRPWSASEAGAADGG